MAEPRFDLCENCFGGWFDRGELEAIVHAQGVAKRGPAAPHRDYQPPLACPRCQATMRTGRASSPVEFCAYTCPAHGIWIDGREIEKFLPPTPVATKSPSWAEQQGWANMALEGFLTSVEKELSPSEIIRRDLERDERIRREVTWGPFGAFWNFFDTKR